MKDLLLFLGAMSPLVIFGGTIGTIVILSVGAGYLYATRGDR